MTVTAQHASPSLLHRRRDDRDLRARLASTEAELERLRAAVERHRADRSASADARLYAEVLSQPVEIGDSRVDDPNDWPAP